MANNGFGSTFGNFQQQNNGGQYGGQVDQTMGMPYDQSAQGYEGTGAGYTTAMAAAPQNVKPRPNSIMPVTIKQIHRAAVQADSNIYTIDEQDVKQVTVVGQVQEISETGTHRTFRIDDGTGQIVAKMWLSKGEAPLKVQELQNIHEGDYVRVSGEIRTYKEDRHILTYRIYPLTDYNEMTYHFLHVIYVHLYNTRGPIGGGNMFVDQQTTFAPDVGQNFAQGDAYANNGYANNNMAQDTSAVGQAIIQFLRTAQTPAGYHRNSIIEEVGKQGYSEEQINDEIGTLSKQGRTYVTIDEDHYTCT